jgi:5-methylthioadenosine/S-adenosylhomocysteine deaminase
MMNGLLITNAWILAMDAALSEHRDGWLHISEDRIIALGNGTPPDLPGAATVDVGGDMVLPGMVNPHCYMPMSLFRGLGEDVDDRLFRYMLPLEPRFVSPEMVRIGSRLAACEYPTRSPTARAVMITGADAKRTITRAVWTFARTKSVVMPSSHQT